VVRVVLAVLLVLMRVLLVLTPLLALWLSLEEVREARLVLTATKAGFFTKGPVRVMVRLGICCSVALLGKRVFALFRGVSGELLLETVVTVFWVKARQLLSLLVLTVRWRVGMVWGLVAVLLARFVPVRGLPARAVTAVTVSSSWNFTLRRKHAK
jgi:hypothetical protein